jgi:hypothetical protein
MIEVFKTNVKKASQAKKLVTVLQQQLPGTKINFDLSDCDKILRVEGSTFSPVIITNVMLTNGFTCSVLV